MKISHKRRKINYTYGSINGHVSFRGGKSIFFESSIERDMILLLEYDSNVIDVIEQPVTIDYVNSNGRETHYTPDLLVQFKNQKSWLIEIKPYKKLLEKWDVIRPKAKVGFKFAKENGYIFHIIHDSKIRGPELELINRLSQYKRLNYDPAKTVKIKSILKKSNSLLISDLIDQLVDGSTNKDELLRRIFYLISNQELWCDLSKGLDIKKTLIWAD